MTARRRSLIRRIAAFVAVLALSASAVVALAPGAWASETGPKRTGVFARFPKNLAQLLGRTPVEPAQQLRLGGIPVLDAAARRMFQLYSVCSAGGCDQGGGTAILIRDLDTLEPAGPPIFIPELPDLGENSLPASLREVPAAVDGSSRLFLWVRAWGGVQSRGVLTVDWRKRTYAFSPMERPLLDDNPGGVSVRGFYGMTYYAAENLVYLRNEINDGGAAGGIARLEVLELDVGKGLTVRHNWTRWIRSCRGPSTISVGGSIGGQHPVLRVGDDSLYVPCNTSSTTAGVVRVSLGEASTATGPEQVYVGTGQATQYLLDEGRGRLHVRVLTSTGKQLLTFDAGQRAFVGVNGLTDARFEARQPVAPLEGYPMGIDEQSGRVYVQSADPRFGLVVLEGSLTPVPPGRRDSSFTRVKGILDAQTPILVDPTGPTLLVPRLPDGSENCFCYDVVADTPSRPAAAPNDPDGLTADVAEVAGETIASFSGEARGYGVRVLAPGGMRGVYGQPPMKLDEEHEFPAGTGFHLPGRNDPSGSDCGPRDRDVLIARVHKAVLESAARSASAISADADPGSKADALAPSRCDPVRLTNVLRAHAGSNAAALDDVLSLADRSAGRQWPFAKAECPVPSENGGTTWSDDQGVGGTGFAAGVDCGSTSRRVAASATAAAVPAVANVSIGHAHVVADVVRDPARGVVGRAQSTVKGVRVLQGSVPLLEIDTVMTTAESWASGRPVSSNRVGAGSTFTRTVAGVRAGSYQCGFEGAAACPDIDTLVPLINTALAGVVVVRAPRPDAGLAKGTPRGYQSAVQRESVEALNNRYVNGDVFLEVPALEIVRFNDGQQWGRQRQIVQIGGVLANAQYGILRVPRPQDDLDEDLGRPRAEVLPAPKVTRPAEGAFVPVPPAAVPPSSAVRTPVAATGFRVLFFAPRTAGLLALIWALLLGPLPLARRRRALLRTIAESDPA